MRDDEIVFDADDEEPDCGICDNIQADEKICIKFCGPEHCWNMYRRTTSWNQLINQLKQIIKEAPNK